MFFYQKNVPFCFDFNFFFFHYFFFYISYRKKVQIDEQATTFEILDTAGQEEFASMVNVLLVSICVCVIFF